MSFQKTAILGGSRGLGLSLLQELELDQAEGTEQKTLVLSRKPPEIQGGFEFESLDFSKSEGSAFALELLRKFEVQRIIYCAGGGPFGAFEKTRWKSHQWSLQVSFLTPAKLLHDLWSSAHLKQFILIGSSVAENQADPMASSYCAGKHALAGLYKTLAIEQGTVDVRLYSPGYMDTDLLPKGSWPRQQQSRLWSPSLVAKDLLKWSNDSEYRRAHKSLPLWADDAEK